MNAKRIIAQIGAAVVLTAAGLAIAPDAAHAYGSWHNGSSITRPVTQNYWHHHRHHHRHYGTTIVL